jgi:NAD(P) transhydrogenase subunit alpha
MSGGDILTLLTIFVLSAFVGFEVISKVPSILHTPLMSGTNAIHGVVLVGSMIVLGTSHGALELTLGFIAVVLATLNVVGGFVVTDRMLEMFKGRQPGRAAAASAAAEPAAVAPAAVAAAQPAEPSPARVFEPEPEAVPEPEPQPTEEAPVVDPTTVIEAPDPTTVIDPDEMQP